MANSTRLFWLIMTAALWTATGARGQELPLPGLDDSASPPDLSLPSFDGEEPPMTAPDAGEERVLTGPRPTGAEALERFDGGGPDNYEPLGVPGHELWADYAAPIESSGTWLRRGFWYAQADAVIWNRQWNRDPKFLAVQDVNVLDPTFFPRTPNFAGAQPVFSTNRFMMLDGAQPGEDASVRFTLGHFLFRDSQNRDHTTEFTAFGGGDWHQHRQLSSQGDFGLFVPFYISGNNRSFNAATHQSVDYSSEFRSFEWNYVVKQRPERDQIVMDANGNWHRSMQIGFAKEYLVGLRLMESRDILDWRAEDIQVQGNDGSYMIRTDNDMVGFQMGTGIVYERSRWSLGGQVKGGVYLNDALGRNTLNFTADDISDSDLRLTNDELSFVGEFKLVGKWHLLPDFSLRASYEMMYLTSQALAPNQATFITDYSYLNTTQDPFYHGASFGFEGYW